MRSLVRKWLFALVLASILHIRHARGEEKVEGSLVKQRPNTWSESSSGNGGGSSDRAERSDRGMVRQGEYGYNLYPYQRPPYYQSRPNPYTVYPYDDAEDIPYYQQQPYRPLPPRPYVPPGYYQPPVTPPPIYPPYTQPPFYPTQQQLPYMPYTPPPVSTTTVNPLAPIGYMLVDTYSSPVKRRAISVPRAFFKLR